MASSDATAAPELRGRKILIVDDDRLNIVILSRILRQEGYIVADVDSGERALGIYAEFRPDLILMDVMMPGMTGLETCRSLKATHGEDAAPVIFITAKAESDDVVDGLRAGGVDYLPKPFRANETLARIRAHLANRLLIARQKCLVDQLRRADAAKNRFLGMAAHDLRNPLASIRGLAEFLADPMLGTLNAEQLDLVKTIHSTSHHMLNMVNELLDVATIASGELKMNPEPTALGDLVAKSLHLMTMEASKKNTRLNLLPTPPLPTLALDPGKISQVITNLLSNAIKYSPPGSLVTASLSQADGCIHFAVRDQGPGIPDGERDRLFKDFGRLSVRPTGGEQSTGLGLAICRNIVEAHKGTIAAENMPGGGCEFRVALPLTP